MRKFCFITFCLSIVFASYSYGMGTTKKPDYARVLNQSICRLNSHPKSPGAKRKVKETYYRAIQFYQQEIDRILMDNEPLKWTKTLDILEKVNGLGDEIRYNSVASQLICDPKIYTSEIADVRQKATEELYEEGISCLNQHSKEKEKEAYHYFVEASKLNPDYKDIKIRIQKAKEKATVRILIEKVAAYASYKNLYAVRFHEVLLNKLRAEFLLDQFVNFYTVSEIKQRKIVQDWTVSISFIDIIMEKAASIDNSGYIYVNGVADIKVFSSKENRNILDTRIPNQFIWKGYLPNHGSDLQGIFDSFSLSMTDQIFTKLSEFIKTSNY